MHPGPVNRGIEISGEAIDSPQSLIAEQVASGLIVRMAILYELLAAGRPTAVAVEEGAEAPTPIGEPA
jgi:aspartate carbamoyltransferase catalytic subunit